MKKIKKDDRIYRIEKIKLAIEIFFSWNKKKRIERCRRYELFQNHPWEQESNALPSGLYFTPKDIVVLDLIAKKDISSVKRGIIKLYKRYYSHKFLLSTSFNNDIDKILMGLDQAISKGRSWYRTNIFDFENSKNLKRYIDYFEVEFLNICSSYAAIEFIFHFSKEFTGEIENFISENYENKEKHISKIWKRNNKKNGAILGIAVGGEDTNESAKSRIIYEQIEYVKLLCMQEMNAIFPLFSKRDKTLYGINIFETNIACDESLPLHIYGSLGINLAKGFLLSSAEKLFVSTDTLYSEDEYETDMMYIYNDQLVTDYDGFENAHNYIVKKMGWFLKDMALAIIYKNMGIYYYNQIVIYRNRINGIKMNIRSYKKLLQLKYEFEKSFYDFNIIREQIPIERESERMLHKLEECDYARYSCYLGYHPYKLFVAIPKNQWHSIIENYDYLSQELDKKIEIAASLKGYKDVRKGYHISWYQFIVAIITLYLMIYSEMIEKITKLIEKIMNVIKEF